MHRIFNLALALLFAASAAQAQPIVLGYFQTKADVGGARNRLCVAKEASGALNVTIATAYCPSRVCMKLRVDGMQFVAPLKANEVQHTEKPGCSVQVKFSRGGALVSKNTESCLAEHPYFYADGWYDFVSTTTDSTTCRPGLY